MSSSPDEKGHVGAGQGPSPKPAPWRSIFRKLLPTEFSDTEQNADRRSTTPILAGGASTQQSDLNAHESTPTRDHDLIVVSSDTADDGGPSQTEHGSQRKGLAQSHPSGHHTTAIDIGRRVRVEGYGDGVVRYVGTVKWVGRDGIARSRFRIGVELDKDLGLNNGSVNGVKYFACPPKHGVFVIPCKVSSLDTTDSAHGLRHRASDKWETESICSTFSMISLATVHSFGSEFDVNDRVAPTASPSCSAALQCGGDFVMLPAAETF